MNYGDQRYNDAASRAMDTVQDTLERDRCECGHARGQHANGQGIQPAWIETPCKECLCLRFKIEWWQRGQQDQSTAT